MKVAIYSRVSTTSQTVENQNQELYAVAERLGWEIVAIFCDVGISGFKGKGKRPAFDNLMKMVSRKEIDLVACWSIDRLGRSLQHLVLFLQEINDRNIDLYLHQQNLDTSTPSGKAMFQMMSVFAEFERSMIRERVKSGLARAKKSGVKLGRPKLDYKKKKRIEKLLRSGSSINSIARSVKVGNATVHRLKFALESQPAV